MATEVSLHLKGCAGEYYVCAELCRRGYLALLSPKSHPLFDVVVTNEGTDSVAIQVKTKINKQGWRLTKKIETPRNNQRLFVVFVDLSGDAPEFYPFEHEDLSDRIALDHSTWLKGRKRDGSARKDSKVRCLKFSQLTDADKARKNDWTFITKHLGTWK